MARREDIETAFWSDSDVAALPAPAKLVYLWAFTNQRNCMAGIYKVAKPAIALETGLDGKALDAALALLEERRFLYYDGRVLFVRARVKKLRSSSPTIAKAIGADLDAIGSHPFIALWWAENGHRSWITDYVHIPGNIEDLDRSYRDLHRRSHGTGTGIGNEKEGSVRGERRPRPRIDQSVPPDGFPSEFLPAASEVLPILHAAWKDRGGRIEPQLRGVCLSMLRNPGADHVRVAQRVMQWLTSGNGQTAPTQDICSRFGDWVEREPAGKPPLALVSGQEQSSRFSEYDEALARKSAERRAKRAAEAAGGAA